MGLVKTILDILFYPIVYILTLLFSMLSMVNSGDSDVSAVSAVKDARKLVNDFEDAIKANTDDVKPSSTTDRDL